MSKKFSHIMNAAILVGGAAIVAHRAFEKMSNDCICKDFIDDADNELFTDDDVNEINEIMSERTLAGKAMCVACDKRTECPWSTVVQMKDKMYVFASKMRDNEFTSCEFGDEEEEFDEDELDSLDGFPEADEDYSDITEDDSFEDEAELSDDNIEYEEQVEEDFKSSTETDEASEEKVEETPSEEVKAEESTEETVSEEETVPEENKNPLKDSLGL